MMMIPLHIIERIEQVFQSYTFVDFLWGLLKGIKVDCIETYLER